MPGPVNCVLAVIVVPLKVVNDPAPATDPPIVVPLIEPPVIATLFAFCVDIDPRPLIAVLGIVAEAVITPAPLPYT